MITQARKRRAASKQAKAASAPPPYYVTKQQELELRIKASQGVVMNGLPTSPVIGQSTSFDDYVRQLMIGPDRLLNNSGNFAATFHVYLNQSELPLVAAALKPKKNTRDEFTFVNEKPPHETVPFTTYSDLSWSILRRVMADHAARIGM